jgi:hypothetical protein
MLSWAPLTEHAFVEARAVTEARYAAIADDIASVALAEPPLFAGDDGRARTAVLLAAIASVESGGFRGDVAFCRRPGDRGHAWGLYQSHTARERVCSSVREATRVALEQVRESINACLPLDAPALAAYASGSCRKGHSAARSRWDRAAAWMRAHAWGASS